MNSNQSGFLSSIPVVTKNLLIINLLAWFADMLLSQNGIEISHYLGLHFVLSDNFMPHQIITYLFMHGNFSHMFFNMFAVFMFGRTLETVWGSKRFLIYYMLTGIFAGITQEIVYAIDLREIVFNPAITHVTTAMGNLTRSEFFTMLPGTVGASGAVFGILLAFGMMFPNAKLILIPIPIPVKAKWFVLGYGIIELVLGISDRPGDNIAHFAHLGGLVAGILIILYWRKKGILNDGHF